MKKFLVLVMVVGLMFTGCAAMQTAGQSVEGFVCDPPPDVVNLVNLGEPFLVTLLSTLVPGSAAYLQAVEALGGVSSIQGGACATVKSINALIALLSGQDPAVKMLLAKKKAMPGVKAMPPFDTTPLSNWLAQAKK